MCELILVVKYLMTHFNSAYICLYYIYCIVALFTRHTLYVHSYAFTCDKFYCLCNKHGTK